MSKRIKRTLAIALLAAAGGVALIPDLAEARIKLITLPVRQRVEIQLDHETATLVEEERIVPLVQGVNQVDFSWANTQIDPGTIVFRVMGPAADDDKAAKALDVKVLSVSYPPNENALVWQVSSSASGAARVRISYILGNLSKSFNYRAVAAQDESTLDLHQYIRVQNMANESFGSTGIWAGFGQHFLKPIGINETKEMLMQDYVKVPINKTYTCDRAEFGYLDEPQRKLRVPMHYVLKNTKEKQMGLAALQFGKVRIFQEDAHGTTAFTGEDWGKFTPIDDEMKLYLGVAQDIVVKRTVAKNERVKVAGNLFNIDVIVEYEIENFKDKPVTLDVVEQLNMLRAELGYGQQRDVQWELGPQTTFEGGTDPEKTTVDKVLLHAKLPARDAAGKAEKIKQKLHVIFKNEW